MHITDLITRTKTSALRFEKEVSTSYRTDTKILVLDEDEVDALLKSLDILKNLLTQAPKNYTELTFRSPGGFEAGIFSAKGKWTVFLKLQRYDSDSYQFLEPSQLQTLRSRVWDGKKMLHFWGEVFCLS